MNTDVLIVGSGIAGLYAALNIDENTQVLIVTKKDTNYCNSYLAQGGISVAQGEEDFDRFLVDTCRAGGNQNRVEAVDILVRESRDNINRLIELGVEFDKKDGELHYTREAAHRINRILHCEDRTGAVVHDTLLKRCLERGNIKIIENCLMEDLIIKDGKCLGIWVNIHDKEEAIFAKAVVMATGGIGGIFKSTTNKTAIKGKGMEIALSHGLMMRDMDKIQFHPTALYEKGKKQRFLISESVRGEGGILINHKGERFVDELEPRDKVTMTIYNELKRSGEEYVFLDMRHLGEEFIIHRFPSIYKECFKRGIDITKDLIPVLPAQHYMMGGIEVDMYSKSSMESLYAVGEVSCTGVHGNNRLASNSLLESLVFSYRAAMGINKRLHGIISKQDISELIKNIKLDAKVRTKVKDFLKKNSKFEGRFEKMNYVIIEDLIQRALVEDSYYGDITTESLIEEDSTCSVYLIAKENGIIAGREVFNAVFKKLGQVNIQWTKKDGDYLKNGEIIAELEGNTRNILTGERIALNLLQRMSGIATITHAMVKLTEGTDAKIVCTRKTTPTFRILEKYAVKVGGGVNHRFSLSDSFMIKDNHIEACGSIKEAVKKAKENYPYLRAIEIEVETLEEVREALDTEADVILLDNMTTEEMRNAVKLINNRKITEASGNMTLDRIQEVARTGVNFISCGALTHSVKSLDVSMKNLKIKNL